MELIDVKWTLTVNYLKIKCCEEFWVPSNYSLVKCQVCGKIEYWHGANQMWDNRYKIMKNMVICQWA